MRKIALLLFIAFAMVQLSPAVMAFCTEATSVFIVDEEKGEDKGSSADKKEKKDYADCSLHSAKLTQKLNTAFHLSEKMYPSPCLEKLIPPPNFC